MSEMQRFTFPLSNENGVIIVGTIEIPRLMTEEQWDRMMATLEVLNDALVAPHSPINEARADE